MLVSRTRCLFELQLQLLNARGETLSDFPEVFRQLHTLCAMMTRGIGAFERVFKLFAASPAGAKTSGWL